MGKSFKDSLKALEADIQHANTLALGYPREKDGARLQMRLSYSPVAHLFLFLVSTFADGKTTMSIYERKASIKDFYAIIFPSLLQLQKGITDLEDRKQKEVCNIRYKRKEEIEKGKLTKVDREREVECAICMEVNSKFVLPNCSHSMCLNCYRDWRGRSQSCPFCRDSLKRVNSGDLWVFTEKCDVLDLSTILREDRKRLFMYIDRLPLLVPDSLYLHSDSHIR
ncbi:hypothetical protein UlMin_013199 [Ulmus minor]